MSLLDGRSPLPTFELAAHFIAAVVFFQATPSSAQSETAGSFSIEHAVQLAANNAPEVEPALRRRDVLRASSQGTDLFPVDPSLNVGVGGRYGASDGVGADIDVQLSQPLPVFGRWGAAQQLARRRIQSASADVWGAQTNAARNAALAFIEVQRAQGQLSVAKQRIEVVRQILNKTEMRLERGDATALDVNLWSSELGRAEATFARRESQYASARIQLAWLCGLPLDEMPMTSSALDDNALVHWAADVLEPRADIVARERRLDAARSRVALEEARAWPDISVGLNVGTEGARWSGGPAGDVIAGVGLQVQLPLFQRNLRSVWEAKAQEKVEASLLAQSKSRASTEVEVSRARLQAAEAAANALKTRVQAKQAENLELLKKAHLAGKLGPSDLLLRQRLVLDAESAYVDVVADLLVARVAVAFATGFLAAQISQTSLRNAHPGVKP